jgi:hypothetical protein
VSRSKHKGTKYSEPFVGIVRSVFESRAFMALSPHACKLLLELAGQYRGDNNGNLTVAWSIVHKRGWRSKTTLWRVKKELIEAGVCVRDAKRSHAQYVRAFSLDVVFVGCFKQV